MWGLFIISVLLPMVQQKQIESARLRLMHDLERKRKSRVITMIHRQEALSFLGFAFSRYIDIEDSERLLRAIRMTPDNMPIDLILHTPGGLVLASEQIARALLRHEAKVTVFVPHYAMSGGTLIALAANEIVMDPNAVLGPIDPQIGQYAAASILRVLREKERKDIDDETIILADMAEKAIKQVGEAVKELLSEKMGPEEAQVLADNLSSGQWTHDYPLTCKELKDLGIVASTDMPKEIYKLMDLYPQSSQRRPSVQYVPLPYGNENPPSPKV
ncbi:MAG: ATP-dependent Clp protease proteolytic subunit [Bacillota bacterium]|nr:ATP-dependent Clp protease proteolytic subunit [Bacillota bacterium]